ncbi:MULTISPECIES: hypothetical protein [unclassified Bradyrhizobium]|uniref:hypothetical protein n=1 Tax=unclassified Bradyrhizobium TaxID=2631580 RepID=UPI0028E659B5|nr:MULTISPECIES: hypothetical protein [unclassified Bradyrhizobium]
MSHMKLVILLVLGGLYSAAAHAGDQKCGAPQLYENLMKSDSYWLVEDDPLPPDERIVVGSVAYQPIKQLCFNRGAFWVAQFGADFNQARIRVVGKALSIDRIRFMRAVGPRMWKALIAQSYTQPRVRFTLSATDGECGARALVLAIDGTSAPEPFGIERWQFRLKSRYHCAD